MKQCRGGGDGGGRVHLKDIPLDNVFLNQVDLETKIETSVDEEVVDQGLDSPYSASSSSTDNGHLCEYNSFTRELLSPN